MPMGRISTIPINNFQGSQTSPAVNVPAGATGVAIDFDGATMLDPAVHVDTVIEFAPDGVTFRTIGGANFQCGGHTRQGDPLPSYPVNCDIPTEGGTRKLRGTLTVTGGSLTTTLHISTSP
jgi:hypothetical protein